jgi:uncharacterized protein (TIGR02145 family)
MKKLVFLLLSFFIFELITVTCEKEDPETEPEATITYGSITDVDGNTYKTVKIGTQTWMAENLKTTKYDNGTTIPLVTDATAWHNLISGACCTYNNTTNADTIATYGRLYNWFAVNTDDLCPSGWHIPTNTEWIALTDYLGGDNIAGLKLKEDGTTHWPGNTNTTNETGFTALPGGNRSSYGSYDLIGSDGYWWSATEKVANIAWARIMSSHYSYVSSTDGSKQAGYSVRCMKD